MNPRVFLLLLPHTKKMEEKAVESGPKKPKLGEEEAAMVKRWCDDLNDILGRGMEPMLQAMGALAVKLRIPHGDVRSLMQYDKDKPDARQRVRNLVKPANTIEEFMTLNRDLGAELLATYLDSVMPTTRLLYEDELVYRSVKPEPANSPIGSHIDCFDLREFDNVVTRKPTAPREQYRVNTYDAEIRVQAAQGAVRDVDDEIKTFMKKAKIDDERRQQEELRVEVLGLQELYERLREQANRGHMTSTQLTEVISDRDKTRKNLDEKRAELAYLSDIIREFEHKSELLLTRQRAAYAARDEATRVLNEMKLVENMVERVNRARDALEHDDLERVFAPAWVYNVVSDVALRNVLSASTYAAFEMGHAHVRRIPGCASYTLRELLCSAQVKDKFMFIVAYAYLSSGDHIGYTVAAEARSHHHHSAREYVNIQKLRDGLRAEVRVANVWFETQTRAVRNPLLTAFDAKCAQIERERVPGDAWKTKMRRFRESLPQREIVYIP